MSNCRIFPSNRVLTASSITSTGTVPTGYEATNLADPDRTKTWKATGGATATLTFQLTGTPAVRALAITGMQYAFTTKFRLKGLDGPGGSVVYDSGLQDAYPASLGFGAGAFGDFGFGGYITSADYPFYRPTLLFVLPENQYLDDWTVDFTDPDGSTTFGAGIVALCNMIEFPYQFERGFEIRAVDTTTTRRSTAGQKKKGRPGTRYDEVRLNFRMLPKEYKWWIYNELKARGEADPFFISLFPDTGADDEVFTTYYGELERPPSITQEFTNFFDLPFIFSETP